MYVCYCIFACCSCIKNKIYEKMSGMENFKIIGAQQTKLDDNYSDNQYTHFIACALFLLY